ncbi:MAG: hypothetical protein AAFY29_03250 [Pseudomonadota bacterium]
MRKAVVLTLALLSATLFAVRSEWVLAAAWDAELDSGVAGANDRQSAQREAELEQYAQCTMHFASPQRQRALLDSDDVDALLIGSVDSNASALGFGVVQSDRIPAEDFLRRLVAADPHDEIYLQQLVSYCNAGTPEFEAACALAAEDRLTILRPGNGFYWALLGEKQYRDGDREAALRSFRIAAEQNLFSVGWGARIRRFYQTELALFPERKSCALIHAAGTASADLPNFAAMIDICRANLEDARWVGACIGLGGAMEHRGRTLATVKIGLAVQQVVYEALGADKSVARVLERKAALDVSVQQGGGSQCFPFQSVESERAWVARIEAIGEVAFLRESAVLGRCPL